MILLFLLGILVFLYFLNRYRHRHHHLGDVVNDVTDVNNIEFVYPYTLPENSFVDNFTNLDLIARQSESIDSYKDLYNSSILSWTDNDKEILKNIVKQADTLINKYFKKLNRVKWKFIQVRHYIENGYIHTIDDSIIVNDIFLRYTDLSEQIALAIHEKIHVYQRKFPEDCIRLLHSWGFTNTNLSHPYIRTNPDTDRMIWMYKGSPLFSIYVSKNPSSVMDVVTIGNTSNIKVSKAVLHVDHPFEIMAYELANVITNGEYSPSLNKKVTDMWLSSVL